MWPSHLTFSAHLFLGRPYSPSLATPLSGQAIMVAAGCIEPLRALLELKPGSFRKKLEPNAALKPKSTWLDEKTIEVSERGRDVARRSERGRDVAHRDVARRLAPCSVASPICEDLLTLSS